ncbi:unnamed protein product [Rhizophagus irregularis]|nr:unnamed protein product [Rhizophagus irregularis]
MDANPDQRPTSDELNETLNFWYYSYDGNNYYQEEERFEPEAIYASRVFTFNNLPKPVNSSVITSYLNDEDTNKDSQDSKLFDLEIPN